MSKEIIDAKVEPVENEEKKSWWEECKKLGREFGDKVVEKTGPIVHVVSENAGLVIPAVFAGFSLISGMVSLFSGSKQREACLSIDDYTGEEVMLKEPMTNGQILALTDKMQDEGLTKAQALDELGLLKKERKRKV